MTHTTTQTMQKITTATSATLLRRFVDERSDDAFAELMGRYDRVVWGVCLRVLHNRSDAEDAFQLTFTLLAKNARRIRKPNSLSSWLYGVAFKTAVRIRQRRQIDASIENHELIANQKEPYEEIALKYQIDELDQQLHQLSEKYRTPLVLFYFQNRTASEISAELGLSITAVEGRLRRGRQQLKRALLRAGSQPSLVFPALVLTLPTSKAIATGSASASLFGLGLRSLFHSTKTGGHKMLAKTLVSTVAVSVLTIGAALHVAPPQQSSARDAVVTSTTNIDSLEPVAIAAATSDTTGGQKLTATEAFHAHLYQVHDRLYNFLKSLHS